MTFKVSDYVTGVDRSYRRSIYQVASLVDSNTAVLNLICFDGEFPTSIDQKYERSIDEFRLATKKELHYEVGHARGKALIRVIRRLIYETRRSSLVRR